MVAITTFKQTSRRGKGEEVRDGQRRIMRLLRVKKYKKQDAVPRYSENLKRRFRYLDACKAL
jgi:hypothetical protein